MMLCVTEAAEMAFIQFAFYCAHCIEKKWKKKKTSRIFLACGSTIFIGGIIHIFFSKAKISQVKPFFNLTVNLAGAYSLLNDLNVFFVFLFFPSLFQRSAPGGKKTQKKSREESDSEEDHSPDPDEDDEDEHAEEHPPPPATASWSSDHNYIAVTPEKTTPISSTVLNKKCMYLFEGLRLLLKPHYCFSIINVVLAMLT